MSRINKWRRRHGDYHSVVVRLQCREDIEKLISDHKVNLKLIVLNLGFEHYGVCVKVYPTVIKVSRQIADMVVFAENEQWWEWTASRMQLLKDMNVVKVPTFWFTVSPQVPSFWFTMLWVTKHSVIVMKTLLQHFIKHLMSLTHVAIILHVLNFMKSI